MTTSHYLLKYFKGPLKVPY